MLSSTTYMGHDFQSYCRIGIIYRCIMGVAIWFVTDKKDGLTITLAITIFILK